jgi:hypothetical protein
MCLVREPTSDVAPVLNVAVRHTDKRIQCDEEFSDSEDEGEGGRRDRHTSRGAQRLLDGATPEPRDNNPGVPPASSMDVDQHPPPPPQAQAPLEPKYGVGAPRGCGCEYCGWVGIRTPFGFRIPRQCGIADTRPFSPTFGLEGTREQRWPP